MTIQDLKSKYFVWMCDLVATGRKKSSYTKLLTFLYNTEFTYTICMDGNRAEDGMDLRYRFGYENNIDERIIASFVDNSPCSVLEMLIALSLRCEEHIMANPEVGNRTSHWFWNMIDNLALSDMDDSAFDEFRANRVIQSFLNRDYKRDGKGGIFPIPHCIHDLRTTEIWYQMMWYLDRVLSE
jgi:hypothetical protein